MPRSVINIKPFYSKLNEFRSAGKYCDVNIEIEQKSFQCHRVVLATACEYFDSMFNGNFKESSSGNVALRADITPRAFEEILQCMYTGIIEICDENAYDLLRASDFLELGYIQEICICFIQKNLPTRNALDIFMFACAAKKKSLTKTLSRYIMEHLEEFARDPKFVEISFDDLCLVLKQIAPMRNENLLVHTIIRWVQHSPEERTSYFDEFAKIIRFRDVTPEFTEFIFRRYISDSTVSRQVSDSDSLGMDLQSLDVSKSKISLHAYVEYLHKFDDNTVTKVFSLNGRTGKWFSKPSYEIHPGAFFLRNVALNAHQYLYCLDYRENSGQTFRICSSIDQYSSSNVLMSPPVVLPRFDICGLKNSIYVYDSCKDVDNSTNSQNEENSSRVSQSNGIYAYERHIDKWFQVPGPRAKRATMTSDEDSGTVYLIGGLNGGAQMYDPRESRWQYLPETNFRYIDGACCSHDGKIYVSGGERDSRRAETFDTVAGKWTAIEPMNRGRSNHRLFFFMNRLYAVGNSFTDYSIEAYDLLFRQWCLFSLPKDTIEKRNPDKRQWVSSIIQDVIVYKPFDMN